MIVDQEVAVFNKKSFGGKRTSDSNESQKKLAEQMLEILLQLPEGKWNLRESVVDKLEELGELPSRREIDAAWEIVKKKASKSYSRKFVLDRRKELIWIDDPANTRKLVLDKKISARHIQKLNELAHAEGCTVDQMVEKLILAYKA
jgi:hypothetical protein